MKNKLLILSTAVFVAGCLVASPLQASAEGMKTIESQGPSQTEKTVIKGEQEPLKVGKYTVSVYALKADKDELSMAGQYMDKTAILEVVKDEKDKNKNKEYLSINLRRTDWMQNRKVMINGKEVEHISKLLKTYEEKNNLEENKTDHTLLFEIPKVDASIKLGMNVIPMGNAAVQFRVDLQDNITKLEINETKDQGKIKRNPVQNNSENKN
ncbi:NEAT domain-containing protein [Marinisporobacter balticus]|uniref:Iron transport-associated protein n=1 Tax=Marinisporobacter balticus TaxID=2018667 RepID=A0A4R2K6L5_9FIRM|nr:NEAT domain-containing protein [Marinisporobacter balticus]TCO68921.1 iron transport-associated protein [Marinisporobacter balticus]